MPEINPYADDLQLMLEASRLAADIAMSYFRQDPQVWYKDNGGSPVSEADIAIDNLLKSFLLEARPDYGWLSEEIKDDPARLTKSRLFIVDPIDGTRAYVSGRCEWCVSIGLVEDGKPVAGVLAAPALNQIWYASKGGGAFLNSKPLAQSKPSEPGRPLRVAISDGIAKILVPGAKAELEKCSGGPSLALRLAAIAQGKLDGVYIRKRSSEWDLAGADALLAQTGHILVELSGQQMCYNEADPSRGVLVAGSRGCYQRLINLIQK